MSESKSFLSAPAGSIEINEITPVLCQVCGHDTAQDETTVRFVCHVYGKKPETLALLCIRCWARGNLWAARKSLEPTTTGTAPTVEDRKRAVWNSPPS